MPKVKSINISGSAKKEASMARKRKNKKSKDLPHRTSDIRAARALSSPASPPAVGHFLSEHLDMLSASGVALLFVVHLFFTDDCFFGSGTDIVSMEHPVHFFAMHWMRQGILPLWNPFVFGGVPFQAGVHGYFYPGHWTGLLFSAGFDIKINIALHLVLAAAGGAWFARGHARSFVARAVCGAVFALSGFMMMHLFAGHRVLFMTAAYLPWGAGALERVLKGNRLFILKAALIWGLMMLSGHYQIIFIGMLGIFIWLGLEMLLKKKDAQGKNLKHSALSVLACVGVLFAGIATAAVQILPMLTHLGLSQRPGDDAAFAASFSSAPANLLTYLLPNLFGNKVDAPFAGDWSYWESLGYLGVAPLFLVIAAHGLLPLRQTLPKTAVILVSLVLALGAHTPIFDVYLAIVPGADLFRSPGRFCVLVTLFGGLLTAQVLDLFIKGGLQRQPLSRFAASVGLPLATGTGLIVWIWKKSASELFSPGRIFELKTRPLSQEALSSSASLLQEDLFVAVFFIVLLGAFFIAVGRRPSLGRIAGAVIALAVTADLYHFGHRFLKVADKERFFLPRPLEDFISQKNEPGMRVIPPPESRFVNFPMMYGVSNPGGYDIFVNKRYAEYINAAQKLPQDRFVSFVRLRRGFALIRHLGPRYLFTAMRFLPGYDWMKPVGRIAGFKIYEDPNPVPRAFLAHRVWVMPDKDARLKKMAEARFDIRDTVILEAAHPDFAPEPLPEGAAEKVELLTLEPNRALIKVSAASDAVLVMSDTLMPGWTARVDGRPTPMVHADHVMRALPVQKGEHLVEMTYLPGGFVTGAVISAVTILLLIAAAFFQRRRQG
jgi:hypothetical protein